MRGEYLKSQPFTYSVVLIQQQKWETILVSHWSKAEHRRLHWPIMPQRILLRSNWLGPHKNSCKLVQWWHVNTSKLYLFSIFFSSHLLVRCCSSLVGSAYGALQSCPHWSAARTVCSNHVPHWSAGRTVRSNHVPHWSAARIARSNHVTPSSYEIFCCIIHWDLVCSSHTSRMALFPIGWERKSLLGLLSNRATR
jgi:hypothetical protein